MPLSALCVDGVLSYKTPAGKAITEDLNVPYPQGALDDRGMYFEQPSVGKAVALAVLVSNMKLATEKYGQDRNEAIEIMQAVIERFSADAHALGYEALQPEVQLAEDLLALMEQGAEQGDLYGQRY